jgi:hypothetical protein
MAASARERREWEQQRKFVDDLLAQFVAEDVGDGSPVLSAKDRRALRSVLRLACESGQLFATISRVPIRSTERLEHFCDSVQAGMDFIATVKQTAGVLRGVSYPPRERNGSLLRLLAVHGRLLGRIQQPALGLERRLSLLLELVQIELIFFAHVW